jgi:hypothetical protein
MSSERIQMLRKHYANLSRAQLIEKLQTRVPYSDDHIAAKQLLDEMDRSEQAKLQDEERARHTDAMRLAGGANHIAKWAIIIAILALTVSVVQTFWRK